jgi:hypothetical protein
MSSIMTFFGFSLGGGVKFCPTNQQNYVGMRQAAFWGKQITLCETASPPQEEGHRRFGTIEFKHFGTLFQET